MLLLLKAAFPSAGAQTAASISVLPVALVETAFQLWLMTASHWATLPIRGFVGFHIFLINVCQLLIFRRHDFISMYTFRIVYYAIWHIAWGYLRLRVLF